MFNFNRRFTSNRLGMRKRLTDIIDRSKRNPNPRQSLDPVVSIVLFQRRRDYVNEFLPVHYPSRVCREANVICELGLLEDRGSEKPELWKINSVGQSRSLK